MSKFGLANTAVHRDYVYLMNPNKDENSSKNFQKIIVDGCEQFKYILLNDDHSILALLKIVNIVQLLTM